MQVRAPALWLSLALLGASACQKEARPPPPPKKCGKVERGSDRVVDVVICAALDADEDGVDDAVDLCPEAKEIVNGVADKDGCPDPDRDQDLFVDYEDACPDDHGVAPDGCPGKDTDGDLIADHLDSCPHEKEDMDGDEDSDGCPDGAQHQTVAKTLDEQLWQRARIDVRRGRAQASKDGAAALDALAQEVATRPADVKRVRIVGYASLRETRRGKAKDLAKDRVKLVEAKLSDAGVDEKAFERAIYPLKDKKERVGRVDVMVFLDLKAAMGTQPQATTPGEGENAAGTTSKETPAQETKSKETKPKATEAPATPSNDKPADEAFPEPETAPVDEDWDLVGESASP